MVCRERGLPVVVPGSVSLLLVRDPLAPNPLWHILCQLCPLHVARDGLRSWVEGLLCAHHGSNQPKNKARLLLSLGVCSPTNSSCLLDRSTAHRPTTCATACMLAKHVRWYLGFFNPRLRSKAFVVSIAATSRCACWERKRLNGKEGTTCAFGLSSG